MSAHRRATRRTKATAPPPVAAPPMIRNTELIGLDEDGNMSLWQRGNVQPVTEFERIGPWIEGGLYVIQRRGMPSPSTVMARPLGRSAFSSCAAGTGLSLCRILEVEAMLLGKVVDDPEDNARVTALIKEAIEALHERQRAPHRRRGKI
jgi:hypothetical protein